MHEYLMTSVEWMNSGDWVEAAVRVGVPDVDAFTYCLESAETGMRLASDARFAEILGARSTPTFVTQRAWLAVRLPSRS